MPNIDIEAAVMPRFNAITSIDISSAGSNEKSTIVNIVP